MDLLNFQTPTYNPTKIPCCNDYCYFFKESNNIQIRASKYLNNTAIYDKLLAYFPFVYSDLPVVENRSLSCHQIKLLKLILQLTINIKGQANVLIS